MSPDERIAKLEALVARRAEQIEQLLAQNSELEAQLAHMWHNSHTC